MKSYETLMDEVQGDDDWTADMATAMLEAMEAEIGEEELEKDEIIRLAVYLNKRYIDLLLAQMPKEFRDQVDAILYYERTRTAYDFVWARIESEG